MASRRAKGGDARAVRWLLDQGADPNARWMHWDASVDLGPVLRHEELRRLSGSRR